LRAPSRAEPILTLDLLVRLDPLALLGAGVLLVLLATVQQAPRVRLGVGAPRVRLVVGAPPAQAAMQALKAQRVQLVQPAMALLVPLALLAMALLVPLALLGAGAPLALLGAGALQDRSVLAATATRVL